MANISQVFFNLGTRLIPWFLLEGKGLFYANLALILANLLPIVGVLFFKWNPFLVLILYWFESAVIGFFNVLRLVSSGAVRADGLFSFWGLLGGTFLSAFFVFHYGMFLFVHLIFLLVGGSLTDSLKLPMGDPFEMVGTFFASQTTLGQTILQDPTAFFLSPLFAGGMIILATAIHFYSDFVRSKAYRVLSPQKVMMDPYPRIIVMHLAIMFGFLATVLLKLPAAIMAVFVVVKIATDIKILNRSYRQRQAAI